MRILAAGLIALGAMTRAEGIHRQPGKHLVFPASPTQRAGGLDTKAVFPHCENAVCLHPCAIPLLLRHRSVKRSWLS